MNNDADHPSNQQSIKNTVSNGSFFSIRVFEIQIVQNEQANKHSPAHQGLIDSSLQQVTTKKTSIAIKVPAKPCKKALKCKLRILNTIFSSFVCLAIHWRVKLTWVTWELPGRKGRHSLELTDELRSNNLSLPVLTYINAVSYTHLTLPTIYSV